MKKNLKDLINEYELHDSTLMHFDYYAHHKVAVLYVQIANEMQVGHYDSEPESTIGAFVFTDVSLFESEPNTSLDNEEQILRAESELDSAKPLLKIHSSGYGIASVGYRLTQMRASNYRMIKILDFYNYNSK